MSDYFYVYPSKHPSIPIGDTVLIKTSNSDKVDGTDTIDTSYNPIPVSIGIADNLHSLLKKTTFYKDFISIMEMEQSQRRENIFISLENIFNSNEYFGSIEEFRKRMEGILNINDIPSLVGFIDKVSTYYYTNNYQPPTILNDPIDVETQWYKDLISSFFILKKYYGTFKAYEYVYKILFHKGSIFLRIRYASDLSFSPFTNKYFRVIDLLVKEGVDLTSFFYSLLPNGDSFPLSLGAMGVKKASDVTSLILNKHDTGHIHDEGLVLVAGTFDETGALKYDTGTALSYTGKGVIFEFNADTILDHLNTFGTTECLMDSFLLNSAEALLEYSRPASIPVMIGTQISLVATNSGKYISNPLVQILNGVKYTHPNIKAKFQIMKSNWIENLNVEYIRIGNGNWGSTVFSDDTEEEKLPYQTDIQSPLFQSVVGFNEKYLISNYSCIATMIHPLTFENERLSNVALNIGSMLTPDLDVLDTIITFPHTSIAPGSGSFIVNLSFSDNSVESIKLIEIETSPGIYDLFVSYYSQQDGVQYLGDGLELSDFITDTNWSNDLEFLPSQKNIRALLVPIWDSKKNKNVYGIFDSLAGKLTIKIRVNTEGPLKGVTFYSGVGNTQITSTVLCSYSTNFRNSIAELGEVKITEVGLFNSQNKMVAYGAFPPIIYNPKKYHISFNCLLELPS